MSSTVVAEYPLTENTSVAASRSRWWVRALWARRIGVCRGSTLIFSLGGGFGMARNVELRPETELAQARKVGWFAYLLQTRRSERALCLPRERREEGTP